MKRWQLTQSSAALLAVGFGTLGLLNLWIFPRTIAAPARPPELAIAAMPLPAPAPAPAPSPSPAPAKAEQAPTHPAPPPPVSVVVLFDRASDALDQAALRALDRLGPVVGGRPGSGRVMVEGHADQTGAERYNVRLSWLRARAVARRLEALGWPHPDVVVKAYGSSRPIHPSGSVHDLRNNRRVEINLRSAAKD